MSNLYFPYRAIGYVTDGNPFSVNRLGEEIFITTSIGSSFQVYRLNKLVACLVSQKAPSCISAVQTSGHETYAAVGTSIVVYDRARPVRTYSAHEDPIVGLLSVGTTLISYDTGNHIKIHDTKERALVGEITLLENTQSGVGAGGGRISALVHPATYVNKFVIGFSNGQLELWNFNTRKLLYTFKSHRAHLSADGSGASYGSDSDDERTPVSSSAGSRDASAGSRANAQAVTCLEQSPACDVVGVGFSSGKILLLHLKLDQVLFSFSQKLAGGVGGGVAVTSLSFRTDAGAEKSPFLASSTADGRIHVWNLGSRRPGAGRSDEDGKETSNRLERKLQSSIEDAHRGPISRVAFIPGEPILVSAGAEDNSLKVWIFDAPDGSARLLRSREAHRGPPTRLRYYGGTTHVSMRDNADGMSCELVSAGSDGTLRLFNTAIEAQNTEMSQKPILKKLGLSRRGERLPDCIDFDFCETRQRDWGNMVSIHKDHPDAYVWKYKDRVVTDMVLKQPGWKRNERKFYADRRTHATAVALSPCGNYCVVGTRGGPLYQYNLQSGIQRGAFPRSASAEVDQKALQKKLRTPGNIYHDMKVLRSEEQMEPTVPSLTSAAVVAQGSTGGHTLEVSGIFVDMMGLTMISCGYDGLLCFWNFYSHELENCVDLQVPIVRMEGMRDANFVAVAGQDRVISVYDIGTRTLARRFLGGHSREITDLAFTPDGRRLLSSALDSTLRVWDLPTGRCLSWLLFDSPVQSMTVSLSGEYLCVAQADREGINVYIDRSLYETVHFWREPVAPTAVAASVVRVDLGEQEAEGADGSAVDDISMEAITPSQAQVADEAAAVEQTTQRGPAGTITLSAIPRAYWTTLFNLEAIKQRNQPVAAPTAPVQAPFFLPSLVREGGSTPSFPTPAEYSKLTQDLSAAVQGSATIAGSKRSGDLQSQTPVDSKKPKKGPTSAGGDASDDQIMQELAGMGSKWSDDDGFGEFEEGAEEEEEEDKAVGWVVDSAPSDSEAVAVASLGPDAEPAAGSGGQRNSTSRIISKRTQLPRCKLVAYLRAESSAPSTSSQETLVLDYLKKLPPPAVDLELRALCTHPTEDAEGVELLRLLLGWLSRRITTGEDFEVLQAYVHRTLTIYLPIVLQMPEPELAEELAGLQAAHAAASSRFRDLVQKNLCILKAFANIPLT